MVDEQERTGAEWKPTSAEPTPEIAGTRGVNEQSMRGGAMGNRMGGSRGGGEMDRMRSVWQSGNPDEIRDEMKRFVEKGVAAFAGVVRGFSERAQREDLAGRASEAIRQTGETANRVMAETSEQARHMRERMTKTMDETSKSTREMADKAKETARENRQSMSEAAQEARKTKESVRESGKSESGTHGGNAPPRNPPGT